ncbi:MAG: pseudouridine synthase [Steroidobacteraceae bacterium]
MSGPALERLQKLLAGAGHGSRRRIEQWIRDGRLTVDGVVASLGMRSHAGADIRLDGRSLQLAPAAAQREVLIYHKGAGEVTTRSDPQGRPTVFDGLPEPRSGRWVVVGRLDVNTTGLLLFTNDGDLAHRLMHPSARIEREYRVRVRGQPAVAALARLRTGLPLADGPARFERIDAETATSRGEARGSPGRGVRPTARSHTWFRVTLREGRNREVRRLWEAAGFEVSRLERVRFGPIALPAELAPGRCRWLDQVEAARLVAGAGSD